MKKNKFISRSTKILLLNAVVILTPSLAAANEQSNERIDPSDMTRAYSQAFIGTSNKGDVKAFGSLSYQFDGGSEAMVALEGTMSENGDYKDSRGQYFHAFGTGNNLMPRVATSLDIIDNKDFTTAAFGAASILKTPAESITLFFRAGGLIGEYKKEGALAQQYGIRDTHITGYTGTAWLVWKPMQDGSYITLSPEYTTMDGSLNIETLKTSVTTAVPLTESGDKWLQFKFDNIDMDINHMGNTDSVTDRVFWTQFKMFF
ncbi:hypothetical protein AB4371_21635 [Vibrio sp. 10N.261.51.A3]